MVMQHFIKFILALFLINPAAAQVKFIVEDFEGFADGSGELKDNGLFTFGNLKAGIDGRLSDNKSYSGKKALKIEKPGKADYGGWGKGISLNLGLDQATDYLNFYIFSDAQNGPTTFRIEIQEDDHIDNQFQKEKDETWHYSFTIEAKNTWELVSIPLSKFKDGNPGGDGDFNIGQYGGRLFVLLFSLENAKSMKPRQTWYVDFITFSKGPATHGAGIFDAPAARQEDFCALGAWSSEGNSANFVDIAKSFEGTFAGGKKLGIVHFFQSFSVQGDGKEYHYPSVERINKVIQAGYIPMITLEDHFVNTGAHTEQPNLYSIFEGHFDSFFGYWAHQIKDVKGTVLLRILHEFNGDWYPWCTVNNDKNPELVGRAFRYIHNIFRENNVRNVKFIWCPNSMSVPQESWNYIMDAYPGDEYVDFVGLDVYNGAGSGKGVGIWRSFRKEAMENYFVLTTLKPSKPILICEAASRERRGGEQGQDKAEWIRQMVDALKTDMSKFRLLAWFNEKETFKVNSSGPSHKAFQEKVMNDGFFRSGKQDFESLIRK
jgi:hypothetical protein